VGKLASEVSWIHLIPSVRGAYKGEVESIGGGTISKKRAKKKAEN